MAQKKTPTLRARWLGDQLRKLREDKGYTTKEAGEYVQRHQGTVSRFESGEYPIRRGDLLAFLDLYGVTNKRQRQSLIALREEVWRTGWWDGYASDVDHDFIDYVWLESRATLIRYYDVELHVGLLQTESYAAAVIRAAEPGASEEQISRWVELRMARQRILQSDHPMEIRSVLNEAVLLRKVGDPDVMKEQAEHLLECAARPNIEIRVLPLSSGSPLGNTGSFRIVTLGEPLSDDVAYQETMLGMLYVESPDNERFVHAYDRLEKAALGPSESIAVISAAAKEWS